ncbi:MAG: C25 family cysteine peptidase [Promethearchaeota archaeon]
MKNITLNRRKAAMKVTAIVFSVMIVTSTAVIMDFAIMKRTQEPTGSIRQTSTYQHQPCETVSVDTEDGTWVSFDGNITPPGTPTKACATVSDTTGLTVAANFFGFWRDSQNSTVDGQVYDTLKMPGASNIHQPGKPMVPMLIEFVEIPHGIDVTLEVLHVSMDTVTGYNIRPALLPTVPIPNETVSSYPLFFDAVYDEEEFFPAQIAEITGENLTDPIIMRGRRLLEITFFPVQFNPASHYLHVYSQIVIKINYEEAAQIKQVAEEFRSPLFERLFSSFILNYNPLEDQIAQLGVDEFVDFYLIVTHENFQPAAKRLADWKTRKGVPTIVEVVDNTKTVDDIKTLIREAYYDWQPTYALLFGDSEFIPCDYGMIHTAKDYGDDLYDSSDDILLHGPVGHIATDVPYFNIEGNDILPEIAHGRISVDSLAEAEIIVDKILDYEQVPPGVEDDPGSFYERILAMAFFSDTDELEDPRNPGTEDIEFPYITTSEGLRQYLHDPGTLYNVIRRYTIETENGVPKVEPEFLAANTAYLDDNVPLSDVGMDIYVPLSEEGFKWYTSYENTQVNGVQQGDGDWPMGYDVPYEDRPTYIKVIRDQILWQFAWGRFLMWHFDHGDSMNMWWPNKGEFANYDGVYAPRILGVYEGGDFDDDMVQLGVDTEGGTQNFNRLPLFLSLECNTGWFDGEIDQDQDFIVFGSDDYDHLNNPLAPESFAERLTRLEGGGALAVVSPTRISFNKPAGTLLEGMVEAFWPELYNLDVEPGYEMGYALLQGKDKVLTTYGLRDPTDPDDHLLSETMIQAYHLFGDPETQLWTRQPDELDVSYPDTLVANRLEHIVVSVTTDDNGQVAVPNARVCIQQGEHVYLVGSTDDFGQAVFDFTPSSEISEINITVTKHNYLPHIETIDVIQSTPTLTLSIYEGTVGDSVDFEVEGFTGSDTIIVTFGASWSAYIDPEIGTATGFVPPGPAGYENVIAQQSDSGQLATALFMRYTDPTSPDPYIYSQWDDSTWHLADGIFTYNNPCIEIYDSEGNFIPSSRLLEDTEYEVRVTVYNDVDGIEADALDTEVRLKFANWGAGVPWTVIDEVVVDVPAGSSAMVPITWTPEYVGHTCLQAEITHIDDQNTYNNLGQENAEVLELTSPGEIFFLVGNPGGETSCVYIDVRQRGNHTDVWEAEILGFSSQRLEPGEYENISLKITSPSDLNQSEWRVFTVNVFVGGILVGGVSINGSTAIQEPAGFDLEQILVLIGGALVVVVIAGVVYLKKK